MNLKLLVNSLAKKMTLEGVPHYTVGVVTGKDEKVKFLEVVVKRPEKYNQKYILKKIPKEFKGYKVKIF